MSKENFFISKIDGIPSTGHLKVNEKKKDKPAKRIEFLVSKETAGWITYTINKVRRKFPELKLGKAKIHKDRLPGAQNIIIHKETERGISFESPTFIDHQSFWESVSDEVKKLKEQGKNIYKLRWLLRK